jgi:hypothetical protein
MTVSFRTEQPCPALGVAGGKFPAQVAATTTGLNKALLITSGREADFLSPFAVTRLPSEAETVRRLQVLGIRTLGQLAALPAGAVLNQFGSSGRFLHQLAQGRDERPVITYQTSPTEQVTRQLDSPVSNQISLNAILAVLAADLAARLQQQGRLARTIRLQFHLDDQTAVLEEIILRQPTAQPHRLTRTLSNLLERVRIQAGVVELTVALTELSPAVPQQLDLFVHHRDQADRLDQVL